MKNLIYLAFLFLSLGSQAQSADLSVEVSNVSGTKGIVIFSLFNKKNFMGPSPLSSLRAKIKDGLASASFKDLKPGEYGVIALHDKNENGKMDYSVQGMPLEDYGVSNNTLTFGPPQWEDAAFIIESKDKELKIRF
ncbi:DUF2141 domain-containing protein [Salinimicrobium oceani]|uniref:DUF2141 domain-containing protein n=1 Tax=Salinimicrobium oceani TaxID=2722702 RepID=A0ABX1CXX8_9FLAO|nr:DUF2141 domain-containing protein [Salinimicrobium oceani]NJW51496.1 DUF2141 domain-containing protein [Salinimicrobium oceani]